MKKNEQVTILTQQEQLNQYSRSILGIVRSNLSPLAMKSQLEDFHEKDVAEALDLLTEAERKKLYRVLDSDVLAEILEHQEEHAGAYLNEMDPGRIPAVLEAMDTDDAVATLRQMEREKREMILSMLPAHVRESISRNASYSEDEIGSLMTSNFILLEQSYGIKQAMSSLIEQASKNDNISTLFVCDENRIFAGAIDLKDLITARQGESLDSLIVTSFPYVYGQEEVEECLQKLKDYSEDSIPVLDNQNRIVGVITAQNLMEATDDAMGEDYAMLAGLTAEEDLREPVGKSIQKRLPWLIILLGLGLLVSGVVGAFESVVSQLTVIMAFQSLILDMAGNVGTQSLAVTIRVLTSEGLHFREKLGLVSKEIRVGLLNGLILGLLSFTAVGGFLFLIKGEGLGFSFLVSGCVGTALMIAMLVSSGVGTLVPMLFKKIGVDPAVASGPLITTVNDLVAVVCYYGMSWLILIEIFHLGG